jgi:hypothetical protein
MSVSLNGPEANGGEEKSQGGNFKNGLDCLFDHLGIPLVWFGVGPKPRLYCQLDHFYAV